MIALTSRMSAAPAGSPRDANNTGTTAATVGLRTVRAVSTSTLVRPTAGSTEQHQPILTATEVHAYYRLGRTAGYELTKRLAPLQSAPGRWRLADLQRLDAERAAAALRALLADGVRMTELADEPALPAARRSGRRKQEA
jgi:hypothetical protein